MPKEEKPENLKLRDALDSDTFDEVVRNLPKNVADELSSVIDSSSTRRLNDSIEQRDV